MIRKKNNCGIELKESQTTFTENSRSHQVFYFLFDLLLVCLCINGAVTGLWATYHISFKVRTSLIFLLITVFAGLIFFRMVKIKWWYILSIIVIYFLAGFWFRYELFHGVEYWIHGFLVYYNEYFNQRLSIPITMDGSEQYCSTILLFFVYAFFAFWMTQYKTKTPQDKRRGIGVPVFILFLMFILPFVTGQVQKASYIICFVLGSISLLVRLESKNKNVTFQMRAYAFACIGLLLVIISMVFQEETYQNYKKRIIETKEEIQNLSKTKTLSDVSYLFTDLELLPFTMVSSGGVSNGTVGQFDQIEYDYKTDAWIYWPQNDAGRELYFKSYIGTDFNNRKWSGLSNKEQKKYEALEQKNNISYENLFVEWYTRFQDVADLYLNTAVETNVAYKVKKTQLGRKHSLFSYDTMGDVLLNEKYLTSSRSKNKKSYWEEAMVPVTEGTVYEDADSEWTNIDYSNFYSGMLSIINDDEKIKYGFYKGKSAKDAAADYLSKEADYRSFVYDTYTKVDSNVAPKLRENIAKNQDIDYDYENADFRDTDYIQTVNNTLNALTDIFEDTGYTLSPGKTPADEDFTDYFLYTSKKGYCVHYATAATIYLRMCGIPARYVEGYYMGNTDVVMSGLATLKDSPNRQYYKLNMTDANAHAWTEVYINGFGWLQVDYTKSASGSPVTSNDANSDRQENAIKEESPNLNEHEPVEPSETPNVEESLKPSEQTVTNNSTASSGKNHNASVGRTAGLSKGQRVMLGMAVLMIMIVAAIYIRFLCISKKLLRQKKSNSSNRRVKFFYGQIEKMLFVLCKIKENRTLKEELPIILERCQLISEEDLNSVIRVTEKASFGLGQVSDYDCTKVQITYEQLEKYFYENMTFYKKLYYKIWKVM